MPGGDPVFHELLRNSFSTPLSDKRELTYYVRVVFVSRDVQNSISSSVEEDPMK